MRQAAAFNGLPLVHLNHPIDCIADMKRLLLAKLLCVIFLLTGCGWDSANVNEAHIPFRYAIPCSLYADGALVGGGVILATSETSEKGVLVTARHVITYNRDYLTSIAFATTNKTKIYLADSKSCWHTVKDKSIDVAWMVLSASEMRGMHDNTLKVQIDIEEGYTLYKGDVIKILNPINSYDACYYKEFTLDDVHFPENLHLKHTMLKVGMVNISTPISDSGSPVFAIKNNKKCLVGTTSISRKDPDATGFINIDRWISPVVHTFNGKMGVKLSACPDLW